MRPTTLDLDAASRRALAYDRLLEWVSGYASGSPASDAIRQIEPSSDERTVRDELATVEELRQHLARHGRIVPPNAGDPRPALEALSLAGARLDGLSLRQAASVAMLGIDAARGPANDPAVFPHLAGILGGLPDLSRECAPVLAGIDGEGNLLDEASPELRRLRVAAVRTAGRLRRLLERHLRDPQARSTIRDDFITERNGRFVVPVRVDSPRPLSGIVHATSSSGATQFVEPLDAVELNNERIRLADEEREEQERVLRVWADVLRGRESDLRSLIDVVVRLDSLQARALFAEELGAVHPVVGEAGTLTLRQACHPLLWRHLKEQGLAVVPLDLELDPFDRVLVISGPNTGGKTVALKTLGLCVVMAQAGIPILARQARLPVYRQVRVDIGDHQSIQADLSTFSAHVGAVVGFLETLTTPALVLFDEIGTGTEPGEGAALARSVLEALRGPGRTTVATTHLGALKTWAVTEPDVVSAAMEFDHETLQPTFRLNLGVPGSSAGLEIAERLGLSPSIVARARALLGPEAREGEAYLRALRDRAAEVDRLRDGLDSETRALAAEREAAREDARRASAATAERADRELARWVDELRRQGERELAGIREAAERRRAERRLARATSRLESTRARGAAAVRGPESRSAGARRAPVTDPRPGMRVWVAGLDREGEVRDFDDRSVEVLLGGMGFRVPLEDLREADPPAAGGDEPSAAAGGWTGQSSAPERELKLLGRRVDEALDELDRYLDSASLAGFDEVRVVHGHGTGRLRAAIRRHLGGHRMVATHRSGGPGEGGDGATVVKLR